MPLPDDARMAIESKLKSGTTQPALVLQGAYELNRAHLEQLLAQWTIIADALSEVGLLAVPLKGLHTVLDGWWTDPGARTMVDLDLLVPADRAQAADRVLSNLGYDRGPENDWADHHLPQRWLERPPVCVELHTALTTARWAEVLPAADVLRSAHHGRMTTTDAVSHSIAHAQLQHEGYRLALLQLGPLYELKVLAAGPRAREIDWDEVRSRFRGVGAERALDSHLFMARSLFGAAVPRSRPRFHAKAHATLCRLDLASTPVGKLQFYALHTPRRFAAGRMHRLYGPGNVWAQRVRHVYRRRLWRQLR